MKAEAKRKLRRTYQLLGKTSTKTKATSECMASLCQHKVAQRKEESKRNEARGNTVCYASMLKSFDFYLWDNEKPGRPSDSKRVKSEGFLKDHSTCCVSNKWRWVKARAKR